LSHVQPGAEYPLSGTARRAAVKNSLYDQDFYAWANEQAALLRAGRVAEADIENIAEEIETIGTFANDCPYPFEQAMSPEFWPE
jgi:hypothetical protein